MFKKTINKHKTDDSLVSVTLGKTGSSIAWGRVLLGSLLYYFALVISIIILLLYRMFQLPAATQYICGEPAELACYLYVMDQLVTTMQWQAIQLTVYITLSLMLWPVFKNAKGKVLLNLGLVSLIVSGLLFASIENNGPELLAAAVCPLFVALLILQRRKRKIVFNNSPQTLIEKNSKFN